MSIKDDVFGFLDDGMSVEEILEMDESLKENTIRKYHGFWKKSKNPVQESGLKDIPRIHGISGGIVASDKLAEVLEKQTQVLSNLLKFMESHGKPAFELTPEQEELLQALADKRVKYQQAQKRIPELETKMEGIKTKNPFDYEEDYEWREMNAELKELLSIQDI